MRYGFEYFSKIPADIITTPAGIGISARLMESEWDSCFQSFCRRAPLNIRI